LPAAPRSLSDYRPTATLPLRAASDGEPLPVELVTIPGTDPGRRLAPLAARDLTVLDTGPGGVAAVRSALAACDVAAVPVQPTPADVVRSWATLDLAGEVDRPARVVLSRTRPRTLALVAAREAFAEAGTAVCVTELPQRESIAAAFGAYPGAALLAAADALLTELLTAAATHHGKGRR
jgi:cellulose biosynthesis protein BcsQ